MEYRHVFLPALLLVALTGSASAVISETILAPREINAHAQDMLGVAHSIPKWWFDELLECHVVLPNGQLYQAHPVSNLPPGNVQYLQATPPFNACGVGVRPIDFADAGTYELYSFVNEQQAGGVTLTRQQFILNVSPVDWRTNEPDQ